jgi:hypothetical protein
MADDNLLEFPGEYSTHAFTRAAATVKAAWGIIAE